MTPTITTLGIILLAVTLGYAGLMYEKPFTRCLVCRLTPADHVCRWCKGTEMRPRLGWVIVNKIRLARARSHAGQPPALPPGHPGNNDGTEPGATERAKRRWSR